MSTLENQEVWDRDFRKLMRGTPADVARRFCSSLMLGHIDIGDAQSPDWIITGGESGAGFRPLDMSAGCGRCVINALAMA
jgi:protein gp37